MQLSLKYSIAKSNRINKERVELSDDRLYHKRVEELCTVFQKVAWLLEKYPHLRDCDKCLVYYYHLYIDGIQNAEDQEQIHNQTSFETIRRVRQRIQNECHRFLPSEQTEEARNIMERATKDWVVN